MRPPFTTQPSFNPIKLLAPRLMLGLSSQYHCFPHNPHFRLRWHHRLEYIPPLPPFDRSVPKACNPSTHPYKIIWFKGNVGYSAVGVGDQVFVKYLVKHRKGRRVAEIADWTGEKKIAWTDLHRDDNRGEGNERSELQLDEADCLFYQRVKKMIVSAYVVGKRELRRNIKDPLHPDKQYIWIPKY